MFDWQNRTDRRAKKEVETTIQKDERRLAMPPKVEATIVVQKCLPVKTVGRADSEKRRWILVLRVEFSPRRKACKP